MVKSQKIEFLFNEEKDLWNIYDKSRKKIYGENRAPQHFIKLTENKTYKECFNDLKKYREKMHSSEFIPLFINFISMAWKKIENEYFKRLEKITKKKFPFDTKAYVTTIGTCPYNYNEKWFMISMRFSLFDNLRAIGHELIHLHFHHYYFEDIEKQIGKEKTHDLKESLTVLLNYEFLDLWFSQDKGYLQHKELREFIEKEWKDNKDFENLLKKCVDFIKKT